MGASGPGSARSVMMAAVESQLAAAAERALKRFWRIIDGGIGTERAFWRTVKWERSHVNLQLS